MYVLLRPVLSVNCLILKFKKNDYSIYVGLEVLREALDVNLDPDPSVMPPPLKATA
jgi:hypothetical protein